MFLFLKKEKKLHYFKKKYYWIQLHRVLKERKRTFHFEILAFKLPSRARRISQGCVSNFFSFSVVKYTHCKVCHVKANNPTALSTFTMLCDRHLYLVLEHFHHLNKGPVPTAVTPRPPPPALATAHLPLCPRICLLSVFHTPGTRRGVAFVSGFIHF